MLDIESRGTLPNRVYKPWISPREIAIIGAGAAGNIALGAYNQWRNRAKLSEEARQSQQRTQELMRRRLGRSFYKGRGARVSRRRRFRRGGSSRVSRINTFQKDAQFRYVKRRGRGNSFARRVRSVLMRNSATQFYTYQTVNNFSCAANSTAQWSYMCGGNTVANNDELYQCFNKEYNLTGVIAAAYPYKLMIRMICLDVQITNSSTIPVVVDLYRLACRKTYQTNSSVDAQFTTLWADTQASPGGGGAPTQTKPPVTVFENTSFCEYWKVLDKKEILINPGNTVTFQMRVTKPRVLEGRIFGSAPQCNKGIGAFYLNWHGSPFNNSGTAQLGAVTLTIATQMSVHYNQPPGDVLARGITA